MSDVKKALEDMGYTNITSSGPYLRMKPVYRDSSSDTILSVHSTKGYFVDFSKQIKGNFEQLTKLSLGLSSIEEAKEFLANNSVVIKEDAEEFDEQRPKIFKKESLSKLIRDHSYWVNRGVSERVLEKFEGGTALAGKMQDRYVFPIFNSRSQLVGVSGRYLKPLAEKSKIPKWKHVGSKSFWVYPAFVNIKTLKKDKEVILVESIGDMLALWNQGITNCLVTFGLTIQRGVLNCLLKLNCKRVIISFNNDENLRGNEAAEKAQNQLLNFFDEDQTKIALPSRNDFGEMSGEEILDWKSKI